MSKPVIVCQIPRSSIRRAIRENCDAYGIHRKKFKRQDFEAVCEAATDAASNAILCIIVRNIESTKAHVRQSRRANRKPRNQSSGTRKTSENRIQREGPDLFSPEGL